MSFTRLNYHIVFATHRRRPVLEPEHFEFLNSVIGGITKRVGGKPVKVNGWRDHVHVVCSLPATVDVASYMSKVKSQATGALKSKFDELGDFRWGQGYGAFTVSPRLLPEITNYVRKQEQIHRRRAVRAEYEEWKRSRERG
jgi:REP element-mobilizing transposase RayT